MRPIVEVMTVNFSLLCLDQIVNNAALLRHMSGGQVSVPLVIRMATGAGRRWPPALAQPGGLVRPHPRAQGAGAATLEDARGMLWSALEDPDPVLIFEHATLYGLEGELPDGAGPVDIARAAVRRPGRDVSIVTYGGTLGKALAAAGALAKEGIEAEVLDLRVLRPLDEPAILASVRRTRRAVIVDEGWRSGASRPRSRPASWRGRSTSSTRRWRASARPRRRSRTPPTSSRRRCRRPRRSPPPCGRWRAMAELPMPALGPTWRPGRWSSGA